MSINGPREITSKASRGRPAPFDAPCRSEHPPSPAGTFHNLGAPPVRGSPMGQHGFEALAGSDPSDALLRDVRCRAALFGRLR